MPKFRNKPRIIDAEQFLDPEKPPRGVLESETYDVLTAQGTLVHVEVGEWIVAEDGVPGRFYPIIDAGGAPKGYDPV